MKASRRVFFLLFTLSGFSGLIYESIWTHYLKLFLGHAAYAQTLVLAIFMGGLALGSWICSRYSSGWNNLLLGYAITEGVIGFFALIFHGAFDHAIAFSYSNIIPALASPLYVNAFKWTLSSALIFPQTILLGMTFPLMSTGILRLFPDNPGRSISLLYFANSIGAAIGVLVSGFLLIRAVGLPGTIETAGVINIAVALTTLFIARQEQFQTWNLAKREVIPAGNLSLRWYQFMLIASLITGMASFIYEVGWIRMLSLVLGSSTHSFELMLSAFIVGLAFGGLWIQHRIDRTEHLIRYLAYVQLIMASLALSTLVLYGSMFEIMEWMQKNISKTDSGYALFNLSSHVIALVIMLPTTFFAGMTLPLITYFLIKRGYGEKSIGAVYAANTIGAIVGVFLAIHVGMPLLGLKGLITLGGSLDMALGLALLWSTARQYGSKLKPVIVTAAGICVIATIALFVNLDLIKMVSGVYRGGEEKVKNDNHSSIKFYKDGKTATVSVIQNIFGYSTIKTNGKTDASLSLYANGETVDESTMTLLAVLPMALNPQAKTVANIGWGSGLTTTTLLLNRALELVDTIEIEQAMIEGAKNFGPRVQPAYTDPRSKINVEDAKTFFSTRNKKYDIIISEPSNPWVSGVAGLFSKEFYSLINNYLTDGGLFCQWVQLYEIDMNLTASILKALSTNFADYVVYTSNDVDMLIVAKKVGKLEDPDANFLKSKGISEALKHIQIASTQDIEIRKIGNKRLLDKLWNTFPMKANSDYYPVLDQGAERTRFLQLNAFEVTGFTHAPLPTLEMLAATGPPTEQTIITRSRFVEQAQMAYASTVLRDYFLQGEFQNSYPIPENSKMQAVQLRQYLSECKAQLPEQERMVTLYNIAVGITPYLKPHELDAIWRKFESWPCYRTFAPRERDWISLFKAVGKRDAKGMVTDALNLLQKEPNIATGGLRYLVASAMLGSLAQDDNEEALQLWQQYRGKLYTDNPSLLFRMLASQAESLSNSIKR